MCSGVILIDLDMTSLVGMTVESMLEIFGERKASLGTQNNDYTFYKTNTNTYLVSVDMGMLGVHSWHTEHFEVINT